MLFNSFHFLLFFPVVALLSFSVPQRWRWALLLLASYYFYMSWHPGYAILILLSTVVDYFAAMHMAGAKGRKRRFLLYLSLFVNLGLLFLFKYFNFFIESIMDVGQMLGITMHPPTFSLLLPVGISFYTFQTISYTIDVYKKKRDPETHFGIFALYVSFFPQLVAGPIERSDRLLPQFREQHVFDYNRMTSGLKLMLWGFFKKMIIADRAALFVDAVYADPTAFSGAPLVIATVLFAFQIYCDFSGYSDIAIGCAQIMGFRLMDNFNRPYAATSITDFWRRWHISLSTWFRDYIYIPLGGNRCHTVRQSFNVLIVFLLSGLWHGANWTFVLWGLLHGVCIVCETTLASQLQRTQLSASSVFNSLYAHIATAWTFIIVCLLWVFFRAQSIADAWYVLTHLHASLGQHLASLSSLFASIEAVGVSFDTLVVAGSAIIFMEFFHLLHKHQDMRIMLANAPTIVRWSFYYALLFAILFFGSHGNQEFIYFQF